MQKRLFKIFIGAVLGIVILKLGLALVWYLSASQDINDAVKAIKHDTSITHFESCKNKPNETHKVYFNTNEISTKIEELTIKDFVDFAQRYIENTSMTDSISSIIFCKECLQLPADYDRWYPEVIDIINKAHIIEFSFNNKTDTIPLIEKIENINIWQDGRKIKSWNNYRIDSYIDINSVGTLKLKQFYKKKKR